MEKLVVEVNDVLTFHEIVGHRLTHLYKHLNRYLFKLAELTSSIRCRIPLLSDIPDTPVVGILLHPATPRRTAKPR